MTDLPDTDADAGILFEVVINQEEQYSLWPADRVLPAGWRAVGVRGSKAECLEHIERVWTDMRPRGLRERSSTLG